MTTLHGGTLGYAEIVAVKVLPPPTHLPLATCHLPLPPVISHFPLDVDMVKTIFQGPNADGREMAAGTQQIICNLLSLAVSPRPSLLWICPSDAVRSGPCSRPSCSLCVYCLASFSFVMLLSCLLSWLFCLNCAINLLQHRSLVDFHSLLPGSGNFLVVFNGISILFFP